MKFSGDYDTLKARVVEHLSSSDSCHDFDHTKRVMHNAELLLRELPQADAEVVRLAALLHDIARPEENASCGKRSHALLGAEMAMPMLKAAGFPEELASRVCEAIRTHRYRSGNAPQSIEAEIVYDADKLDSLGAVGIGRAFLFAGRVNARLHNTKEAALGNPAYSKEDTAYREYLVKLSKLPEKMLTEAGRRIGRERAAVMAQFFARLDDETAETLE